MSTPVVDIFPQSVQGKGKVRVQWVKTLADTDAPTLAEINASTSFDATCYFQAPTSTAGTASRK
ncbi:hypothetical protein ACQCX2_07815 [Propionibacteriaceae bacterium Y1700]|uniref:phage tail tube protein n=1 Tax=Microlunatus sp. Y1700 TaxID=3418487 RepID=UPI003DA72559